MSLTKSHRANHKKRSSSGFTAIELVIAAGVFSIVLIVALSGFLAMGRMFYKGVAISNTQNVALQLMNSITTDIQNATSFGGSQALGYYCFGPARYSFREGIVLSGASSYAVYRDTMSGANACGRPCVSPGNPSGCVPFNNPKEFLGTSMRISRFSVTPKLGSLYQVDLTVAYGIDGVLSGLPGSPACIGGQSGGQYCAVSKLSSIVSLKDYNI